MPWAKGQSGNPHGRAPKGLAVAEYVGTKTQQGRAIIRGILEIARNGESESVRLAAWQELGNRFWGKPVQAVMVGAETPQQRALEALLTLYGAPAGVVEGEARPALSSANPGAIAGDGDGDDENENE